MPDYDVCIIGSGPAGAEAAAYLVKQGVSVCMLDGGYDANDTLKNAPDSSFDEMRRTRDDQYKWFLGEDCGAIPLSGLAGGLGGGQTSGNRGYVINKVDEQLPTEQIGCAIVQSLAKGGLGAVWGAASAYLDPNELTAIGLDPQKMEEHYDAVTKRIGISGPQTREGVQAPMPLDHHGTAMMERYKKKAGWFTKNNITVGQPHSAVLTEDLGNRKATALHDMEYWADSRKSVYRPQFTIDDLGSSENFTYRSQHIVERCEDNDNHVTVHAKNIEDNTDTSVTCKKVILAAGAIGSARIALRSFDMENVDIPFVGKPHDFIASLHPKMLGNTGEVQRTSLCQLLVVDSNSYEETDAGCAQIYTYKSLQLFRLLAPVPLPTPEAMELLAMFAPALVIADVRYPMKSLHNTMSINGKNTTITMHVTKEERTRRNAARTRMKKALKKLGLLPLKTMELPEGSTSHYAGTIPMDTDAPLRASNYGNVNDSNNIFIADAAMFRMLPCKPHTLTLMANARRIAAHVLTSLQ